MMGEDVPGKVMRNKERAIYNMEGNKREFERKAEKKREAEKERKRRAALSDYERREEDRLIQEERDRWYANFTRNNLRVVRGRGRGSKKQPFTSLAHLPFWDN